MKKRVPSSAEARAPGGPWPSMNSLRLALLARIQNAENVDLMEFFRQVYPQALEGTRGSRPEAVAAQHKEAEDV